MKFRLILLLIFLGLQTLLAQGLTNSTRLSYTKNTLQDTSILVLQNGLAPTAVLTEKKDIYCVATDWIEQFPLVAAYIDSSGKSLWNNYTLPSLFPNYLDTNLHPFILPSADGGVFIIFEYLQYKSTKYNVDFYAVYPHIQYIDASGNRKWGDYGKRLTNMEVDFQGGATIQGISFSLDGDILVFWTWYNLDSLANDKGGGGTFVQKVDALTGELKFGDSGRKLYQYGVYPIIKSETGNIYMYRDSVACFNSNLEKQWQLPLLDSIKNDILVGTNEYGELLIIYGTGKDLRGRLYNKNGNPIWIDKILTSSKTRILPEAVARWINDSWVFKMGQVSNSVFCVDRNGNMKWGDSGIHVSERIISVSPIDSESILVAYLEQNLAEEFYIYDLYIQKLSISGELLWQSNGIKVVENSNLTCTILPDQNGGAFLLFDALTTDDPQFRPRGTYFQRVDKNGNLGLITSVNNYQSSSDISTTTSAVCYPNPFNPSTKIKYEIPTEGKVTIKVYDVLGKEVSTLLNENKRAGSYEIEWNAKNYASGVYLYNLTTGNNSITKKMLLMK